MSTRNLLLAIILYVMCPLSSVASDLSDSAIVRRVLDQNGHKSIMVDSIAALENGRITYLYFSKLKFDTLPDDIGRLNELRLLYINCCSLKVLPDSFVNLKNLKILFGSDNLLKALPQNFGKLENLIVLDLFNNKLESIPNDLGLLKELKNMSLSYNQLDSIPTSLALLTKAQVLSFSNNRLKKVPEIFYNMDSLRSVNFSNNLINEIPESIAKIAIKNLMFDIWNNRICFVSDSLDSWLKAHNTIDWKRSQTCDTSNIENNNILSEKYPLKLNPNPFTHSITIVYNIPNRLKGKLLICSVDGRIVKNIDVIGKGLYLWKAESKLACGMYFCRLSWNKNDITRKIVLW